MPASTKRKQTPNKSSKTKKEHNTDYIPKKSKDKVYKLEVKTVSVDAISAAIEDIINQLHEHEVPNRRFIPDDSASINTLRAIMGESQSNFSRSVRKLKSRLFHLERYSEMWPIYTFRSIDSGRDKIDEYIISFDDQDGLKMIIDMYEKGIASSSSVAHSSHIIDLKKQPSAFKQHVSKAFNLIGVAILVELVLL